VIGETIGNFRVLSRLGRGGMGEVFLAEHTSIQTKVAVKVLHSEVSRDTDQVQRFFNEARIVGRIKHAGIVKIFDVGFFGEHAYLIMELLEGQSLAHRLEHTRRMSAAQIGDIGRQIASILEATHRAGVTHRDLKPDNIFLVSDDELPSGERVKILDFGIAKLSGTLAGASPKTHGTMGTPTYMAPEQWGDSGQVDWRADAYSLGCVAFEMACGRPPFVARTIAEACAKHLSEEPPRARAITPDLPPALDALIARMLAKKPGARPAMAEIAQAFETLAGDTAPLGETIGKAAATAETMPVAAVMRTTLGESTGEVTKSGKPRVMWGVAAFVGAAAIAGGVVFAMRGSSDEPAPAPTPAPVAVKPAPPPPPPTVAVKPAKIALHVDSEPSGADVFRYLDGVHLGVTPYDLEIAPGTGELMLVIKKPGYRDEQLRLPIDASAERRVDLVKLGEPAKPVVARPAAKPKPKPERKRGDLSDDPYN
jgi:hypothetical protein